MKSEVQSTTEASLPTSTTLPRPMAVGAVATMAWEPGFGLRNGNLSNNNAGYHTHFMGYDLIWVCVCENGVYHPHGHLVGNMK